MTKDVDFAQLSVSDFIKPLLIHKFKIILSTLIFSIAGVFYSLSLPNIYKSEGVYIPNLDEGAGGISGLASKFGGLASLAGISLGSTEGNESLIAIETLKARVFILKFIKQQKIEVELFAAEGWNKTTNELLIDEDIYDVSKNEWVREVDEGESVNPTDLELYEAFLEVLEVNVDDETGLIRLAIKHYSPSLAKKWLELYVVEANSWMKNQKHSLVTKNIENLNKIVNEIKLTDTKSVIYELMEEQIQAKMLTMTRDEYAFKTIDPPFYPELKSEPKRALICIVFAFLGGLLSSIFVLVKNDIEA
ncbi:lipopolysaccharide biosynthesis protein [Pseudoalteromonas sp. SSM20]|uniref:lipopolysaccharide biosynthesis protein n=1 Tax=Pseudoalteromonas sp. SSM20 TaxID=3139394 RepID=UPI003BADABB0